MTSITKLDLASTGLSVMGVTAHLDINAGRNLSFNALTSVSSAFLDTVYRTGLKTIDFTGNNFTANQYLPTGNYGKLCCARSRNSGTFREELPWKRCSQQHVIYLAVVGSEVLVADAADKQCAEDLIVQTHKRTYSLDSGDFWMKPANANVAQFLWLSKVAMPRSHKFQLCKRKTELSAVICEVS